MFIETDFEKLSKEGEFRRWKYRPYSSRVNAPTPDLSSFLKKKLKVYMKYAIYMYIHFIYITILIDFSVVSVFDPSSFYGFLYCNMCLL